MYSEADRSKAKNFVVEKQTQLNRRLLLKTCTLFYSFQYFTNLGGLLADNFTMRMINVDELHVHL